MSYPHLPTFTSNAAFTIKRPVWRRGPQYVCTLEAVSADTFKLNVTGLGKDELEVPAKTLWLKCKPTKLGAEVRERLKDLHPDLILALEPFQPADKWKALVDA